MSVTALPLTNKISQTSGKSTQANILEARYGDGYSQRTPNGINYVKQMWNINWENITNSELQTIESAITTARYGADAFTWTPFGEVTQKKFRYMTHDVSFQSGNICSVSMQLEQVYDI